MDNWNSDEVCIVKQDIISTDARGFPTVARIRIMKDIAAGYRGKYGGKNNGLEDMKIGVVQFCKGEIMPDGSITQALLVQKLTYDMAEVKAAVVGLVYKKNLTNVAQALTVSEKVRSLGADSCRRWFMGQRPNLFRPRVLPDCHNV